jgi:putative FmdB family regulatory protein
MPIYAYHCEACNIDFDEFATISERNEVHCRRCHTKADKRIVLGAVYGDLDDFSNDPGGARWNHQLQTHVTSVKHAKEIAAKRGMHAIDH